MKRFNGNAAVWSCLAAGLLSSGTPAKAQIIVDWPSKTLVAYPPVVDRTMNVTVTVNDVNDLIYAYSIKVTAAPHALDDAAKILEVQLQTAAAAKAGLAVGDCAGQVATLNSNVSAISGAMLSVFDGSGKKDAAGKLSSISLSETIAAWNSQVRNPWMQNVLGPSAKDGTIQAVLTACTGPAKAFGDSAIASAMVIQKHIDFTQAKVDGPHRLTQVTQISPENDYTVTVTETWNGNQTAQFTGTFTPQSNVLTLSLGALMSGIQQRTYTSSKDPGNTQQNLLSVGGGGRFTPLGTALLNYQLPWRWADGKDVGLALSSGMVLRFGDTNVSASSLGWFGGPSLHLFHRLFISVGVHVGQFTEFPAGLHSGSVVPSNYGDLTGVNRSTGRFAFAVTYQTKQFNSGSSAPKTSSTGTTNQ